MRIEQRCVVISLVLSVLSLAACEAGPPRTPTTVPRTPTVRILQPTPLPTRPRLVLATPTSRNVSDALATQLATQMESKTSGAATLAAKQALAKTRGISIDQVTVEKLERVTWPNTCLGVALKGMACQEFQTPGFRIVLSAGGKTYEYHTNLDGSQVIGVP